MMTFRKIFISFMVFTLAPTLIFAHDNLSKRPDVQVFIDKMVEKYHFNEQALNKLFDQVHLKKNIIEIMNRPYESKPWYQYRNLFITNTKIANGVKFWQKHQTVLLKIEKEFKVDPDIIIATIGIESNYGKHKGNYKVIDSLSTLAFEFPRRAQFFQKELAAFLLMARDTKQNPLSFKGSYAGAIGQPQFMPSSFKAYAVDYDGNQKIDLMNDEDDVMASIANYYHKNGWRFNQPVAVKAIVSAYGKKHTEYYLNRANTTLKTLEKYGIKPARNLPQNLQAKLISLTGKNGTLYWITFHNFKVIRRYNPSNHYAMAVYQLSEAIDKQRKL